MKMNKQTIQVMVLSGLMLILIIWAIMEYGGFGTPAPAPVPAPPKPAAVKKPTDKVNASAPGGTAAVNKDNPADLLWINTERLANIVNEVKGGRNPFEDLMLPAQPVLPTTVKTPKDYNKDFSDPNIKPLPSIDAKLTQQLKLSWLNAGEVKKLLAKEGFQKLMVGAVNDSSHSIKLSGIQVDVEDAMKLINGNDKEPPKPKFRLIGVLQTNDKSFVVIAVNGQQYELYEGDTINKLGWSVAAINASGVRLTKGRQTILLPIGGLPQ
jgi:hypothetical protein